MTKKKRRKVSGKYCNNLLFSDTTPRVLFGFYWSFSRSVLWCLIWLGSGLPMVWHPRTRWPAHPLDLSAGLSPVGVRRIIPLTCSKRVHGIPLLTLQEFFYSRSSQSYVPKTLLLNDFAVKLNPHWPTNLAFLLRFVLKDWQRLSNVRRHNC